MVMYEVVWWVSRHATPNDVKNLVQKAAAQVIGRGGLVKKIQSLGQQPLVYDFRTKQERHSTARYFTLELECSPSTLAEVKDVVRLNPHMLRSFVFRRETKVVPKIKRIPRPPQSRFEVLHEAELQSDVPEPSWKPRFSTDAIA